MLIKEKVRWIVDSKWKTIVDFFSKNRRKQIKKVTQQLNENNFTFWVKECSDKDFKEFLILYNSEIKKKENAKVHDLYSKYKDELWKWILFFLYIRDKNNTLIAWWIWIKRDNMFIFWYKASNLDYTFWFTLKIWIWNILDYLLFKTAIEKLHSDFVSFWRDRNWYWTIWAKASLPMTKMPLWLRAYNFNNNLDIEISTKDIKKDTIIFYDACPETNKFKSALLYVSWELNKERVLTLYSPLINSELNILIKKY